VTVHFEEVDDLSDCCEKGLCGFVGDHVRMTIPTESVPEEEEAIVMAG
jgi:hypothetical protein